MQKSWRISERNRHRVIKRLAMRLLVLCAIAASGAACSTTPEAPRGCIGRSDAMLEEIASGQAACAPALYEWYRRHMPECGWE